jgi:purine-cytosine permease-like protein
VRIYWIMLVLRTYTLVHIMEAMYGLCCDIPCFVFYFIVVVYQCAFGYGTLRKQQTYNVLTVLFLFYLLTESLLLTYSRLVLILV